MSVAIPKVHLQRLEKVFAHLEMQGSAPMRAKSMTKGCTLFQRRCNLWHVILPVCQCQQMQQLFYASVWKPLTVNSVSIFRTSRFPTHMVQLLMSCRANPLLHTSFFGYGYTLWPAQLGVTTGKLSCVKILQCDCCCWFSGGGN